MKVSVRPTYEQLKNFPIGEWILVVAENGWEYLNICGKDCMICLVQEPTNLNRGTFHAKLEVLDPSNLNIEPPDGWEYGRYYFDVERAKAEVEAWLRAWKQLGEDDRNG